MFRDDQYIPIQGSTARRGGATSAKAGAGTLLEHSIHDLDLLEWCVGPVAGVAPARRTSTASPASRTPSPPSLALRHGGPGALTSIWHDILERPSLRRVEIFCERGYVVVEGDWSGPVRWEHRAGDRTVSTVRPRAEAVELGAWRTGQRRRAFVEAVGQARPAWPRLRRRPPGPRARRRRVPVGRGRRHARSDPSSRSGLRLGRRPEDGVEDPERAERNSPTASAASSHGP